MTLIFTDRSRQETGLQQCLGARYWQYHSVTGYGIVRKEQNLPAHTGIFAHLALAGIFKLLLDGKVQEVDLYDPTTRKQIRVFIKEAQDQYKAEVEAVGFLNEPFSEIERVMAEQCNLIEGMVWGFLRTWLNTILSEYEIVAVEFEESYVIGCTCGVGTGRGEIAEHRAQDCNGVVQQGKPDITMRRRVDGKLGVHDFKTSKYFSDYEVARYQSSMQMATSTVTVERRLGEEVSHYVIWMLLKGDRKRGYNKQTREFDQPKQQQSRFCYVGWKPSNPPLRQTDEVSLEQKWYLCEPVWEIPWEGKPEEMSGVEWLVMEKMTSEEVQKQFVRIGPYDRQGWLIQGYLRQVARDERRWVEIQWRIYEDVEEGATILEALDDHVPRSWNCNKFGSRCPYWELCTDPVAAQDPLRTGLYIQRVPHHDPELEAMQAAGVELPKEGRAVIEE